mmetsp:Transcript_91035/g.152463  ORF Transcript_91035/g.152463 Transcript_91035/m.152463 type:complete len:218 (-) Transcript_91035:282-935(-)
MFGVAVAQPLSRLLGHFQSAFDWPMVVEPLSAACPLRGYEERPNLLSTEHTIQDIPCVAVGDDDRNASGIGQFNCLQFGRKATSAQAIGTSVSCHTLRMGDFFGEHSVNELGGGVFFRVAVVQPVHLGQNHQQIRPPDLRHGSAQSVVVPDFDLVRGHGIVLVSDGDDVPLRQGPQGAPGVDERHGVGQVVLTQQELRHGSRGEGPGPRIHESRLSD